MYKITEESLDWIELESVDSTNTYLLDHLDQWEKPTCVTAKVQTAGRGRQGKSWYSSPDQQLLFSFCWSWQASFSPAPLSLVAAKTIAQSLMRCLLPGVGRQPSPCITVKWPNDLQIEGKKLAGILLESEATASGLGVVIGVGINYLPLLTHQVEQPVISLAQYSSAPLPEKRTLLRTLVLALASACEQAQEQGFAALLADWSAVDALYGKQVMITQAEERLEGVAAGIDTSGALRLQQGDHIRLIQSGTIRLL